jgi:integrase
MPKPLTPAFLKALKLPETGQVEHADAGCPGLRLRLSTATASWGLGCRDVQGRMRRFTLGRYPDMGLRDAREAARALRSRVRAGADPVAEARARRAGGAGVTLRDVIDSYGQLVGRTHRAWSRSRQLVVFVFAASLTRKAIELTAPELQLVVDGHASRASAGAAVRYLRPILRWGVKRGLVSAGAAAIDQPKGAQGRRDRALSRDELRAILNVLDGFPHHGDCVRWLAWTCCRLGEACNARWDDVDLERGLWVIPITKSGKPFTVPLPRQAVAFLRERGGSEGLIFASSTGRRLTDWDRVTKKVQKRSGTEDWTRHDIRRSCATLLGELGTAPHIIERVLNHAMRGSVGGSAVASVYIKSTWQPEHRAALQLLADELDRIASGAGDNIVRLHG